MLKVEMLPASYGDALWIEYGDVEQPSIVIVDCGFKSNYHTLVERIAALGPHQLELLVLTHVDEDHIKGAIPLLADLRFPVTEHLDVWFNGWRHLVECSTDKLGSVQGEFVSGLILDRGFRWNCNPWDSHAVVLDDASVLPSGRLAGGLEWTLLSPTRDKLHQMKHCWAKEVEDHSALEPGDHEGFLALFSERRDVQPDRLGERPDVEILAEKPFEEDTAAPNGSSIALLLEYDGRSLLLAGDAHPSVVVESLRRLARQREVDRIVVDAFKVSHHGSPKNTSAALLDAIDCRRYLFSSSGARWGYPSEEAIARILVRRVQDTELIFNYQNEITSKWRNGDLVREFNYRTIYPEHGRSVVVLS